MKIKCPCCNGEGDINGEYNVALKLFGGIETYAEGSIETTIEAVMHRNHVKKSRLKYVRKMLNEMVEQLKTGI